MSDKRILSVYAAAQKSLDNKNHRIPTVLEEKVKQEKSRELQKEVKRALILTMKRDKIDLPVKVKAQH